MALQNALPSVSPAKMLMLRHVQENRIQVEYWLAAQILLGGSRHAKRWTGCCIHFRGR